MTRKYDWDKDAEFYHIHLNIIGSKMSAYALKVSKSNAMHTLKVSSHKYKIDSGQIVRVVTCNQVFTLEEATVLCEMHIEGKFKLEDTGTWD